MHKGSPGKAKKGHHDTHAMQAQMDEDEEYPNVFYNDYKQSQKDKGDYSQKPRANLYNVIMKLREDTVSPATATQPNLPYRKHTKTYY